MKYSNKVKAAMLLDYVDSIDPQKNLALMQEITDTSIENLGKSPETLELMELIDAVRRDRGNIGTNLEILQEVIIPALKQEAYALSEFGETCIDDGLAAREGNEVFYQFSKILHERFETRGVRLIRNGSEYYSIEPDRISQHTSRLSNMDKLMAEIHKKSDGSSVDAVEYYFSDKVSEPSGIKIIFYQENGKYTFETFLNKINDMNDFNIIKKIFTEKFLKPPYQVGDQGAPFKIEDGSIMAYKDYDKAYRIYFEIIKGTTSAPEEILVYVGGNKNQQSTDIKTAKKYSTQRTKSGK